MSFSLEFRDKLGAFTEVALPDDVSASLSLRFEGPDLQATADDLSIDLDNTDGSWDAIFTQANLDPTDVYPARYGFRVKRDGTPIWEGDLDYGSVEMDGVTDRVPIQVLDPTQRLTQVTADTFKRDYSAIAIVSGAKQTKHLVVNSVLDADGEPLEAGDEITLGHYKPQAFGAAQLAQQDLVVASVDTGTNTITFTKRLKTNYIPGDAILVHDAWYRGHTVQWLVEGLLDRPGLFDAAHRVINYDALAYDDVIDIAEFANLNTGQALEKLGLWVNAQVWSQVGVAYFCERPTDVLGTTPKNLDALLVSGAPKPIWADRVDQVKVTGRDGRWAKRGILPDGGVQKTIDLPFSTDRAKLQEVADRTYDYWGRQRHIIEQCEVWDDGTVYQLKTPVVVGGVAYFVTAVNTDLQNGGVITLGLIEDGGVLPDLGTTAIDSVIDPDEEPPEPVDFTLTKAYSTAFEALFPKEEYPRHKTIREQVGELVSDGTTTPVFADRLWRLYEFRFRYPYPEYTDWLWRFEATCWPDGKDRDKAILVFPIIPDLQPDGYYYAARYLRAGKLMWADVLARTESLKAGIPSDTNNSTVEDDIVGVPHFYSGEVTASLRLLADTRPIDPDSVNSHYYSGDVDATLWLEVRPDGVLKAHKYAGEVMATMWLRADSRPIVTDRIHRYSGDVDATLWLEARPDGVLKAHKYAGEALATLWLAAQSDIGDPAGTGLTMVLTSYVDNAPGTAARECDLTATLSGSAILADRVIFHATRNGTKLAPQRVDIDAGSTSVVAHWPRCAKAGDTLAVTVCKLRLHHKKTALSGVSSGPPWSIAAGASQSGHDGGTGLPAALPAPTVAAVTGSGGPHSFEVDISWSGLTSAEKDRLYKVKVWVYHGAWVEKEPVDVRQLVLAGITSTRVKLHVAKKLTSGASNYPNVKALLRDYDQQNGAAGYLYGTGDGTTASNSPQVPALEFFSTDNGFLRALQVELTDALSSPTLAEVLSNCLLTTANKAYWSGGRVVPRPVVVRDGSYFSLPAGVELFNGMLLVVWNGAGTSPGWFNLFAYYPRFMGLAAWSAATTYAAGEFCYSTTTVYRSKLGSNLNHAVSDGTWWASVGSVPAANKWAKWGADAASSDTGLPADPSDPVSGTEPPEGGGGCFSGATYVLTADWEAVRLKDLWDARLILREPEMGIPVMGYEPNARTWCVTGAVEVLRHPGKFALLDALGLEVTPDHLCGVSDPSQGKPTRTRWKASGVLNPGDHGITLRGKTVGCEPVEKLPAVTRWAKEVFNLRTGTGNFWVSGDGLVWHLVHNVKAGL